MSAFAAVYLYHTVNILTLRQPWYNGSRTSRPSFCNSYYTNCGNVCARVCVCICACHSEHKPDDSNPHFLLMWKAPVQYSRCTAAPAVAAVQHWRTSHRLIRVGTPVLTLFNLRHPRDFKSPNIPKGNRLCCMSSTIIYRTFIHRKMY